MTAICETLRIARSNVLARLAGRPSRRIGRPPLPEANLLKEIEAVIEGQSSWGYIRIWAHLRRKARAEGGPPANRKRIYRIMKVHGLLLQRHAGGVEARHLDGRVAFNHSNTRWCSDGFEITGDNKEKVRVAFALDCCDRKAMGHVATTGGIKGEDIRDLMVSAVEH